MDFRYLGGLDRPDPTTVDYQTAWDLQRAIHAQVAAREIADQVLFVEHDPVYTAGRRTEQRERPRDGTPVIDVDRGGKITWHGPGQLTCYPIIWLPDGIGVVDHVRCVEAAVIAGLADYGLDAIRVEGRTGVWLPATDSRPERKICAIGIRVAKRTSLHGFALNVDDDLTRFDNIIPCGIEDAGVTSLARELPAEVSVPSVADVARSLEPHLRALLSYQPRG